MSPFIAENFVDFDYVWEILDQLSSWYQKAKSSPGFLNFIKRFSYKIQYYDNNFGKGNGSDEPNWRYRSWNQMHNSSSPKGIACNKSSDKSPAVGKVKCETSFQSKAVQTPPTPAPVPRSDTCNICNMKFPSRNKLFKHLNSGCTGDSLQSDEIGKVPADSSFTHRSFHVQLEDSDEPNGDRTPFWVYAISAFIILKLFDLPTIFDEAFSINY